MIAGPGNDQAAITAFLAGKGMPAAGIAGVEGNFQVESKMHSTAVNPGEDAHGYAQWEGGRWSGPNGLQAFARAHGASPTDPQAQLNFLWAELNSPAYSQVLTGLMTATDPGQAATLFDQQYERSSPKSLPTRVANAQAIFAGGVVGGSGSPAGSGGAGTQDAWNPLGTLAGGIWAGMYDALKPVGRVLVSGGLVVLGLLIVVVAAVVIAKSGDSSDSAGSSAPAPAPQEEEEGQGAAPAPEQHQRRGGKAAGAVEGGAEDAAVVAA